MNRKIILALSVFVYANNFCAAVAPTMHYTVERVSTARITSKQAKVADKIYKHACARYAILGLMGAGVLAWMFYTPEQVGAVGAAAVGAAALEVEIAGLKQRVNAIEGANVSILNPLNWVLRPFSLVKQVASVMVISGLASGGSDFIKTHISRFFHGNTLAWFMSQKDVLEKDLRELHYYGNMLETTQWLSEDDTLYCKKQIEQTTDRIVNHVEYVVAFMQYKLEKLTQITGEAKKNAQADVDAIIRMTNKMSSEVELIINGQKSVTIPGVSRFAAVERDFKQQLGYSLNSFDLLCKRVELQMA